MASLTKFIFPIGLRSFWGKKDAKTGEYLLPESAKIPFQAVSFIDPTDPGLEEFYDALRGEQANDDREIINDAPPTDHSPKLH